jgi:hypothetical protein
VKNPGAAQEKHLFIAHYEGRNLSIAKVVSRGTIIKISSKMDQESRVLPTICECYIGPTLNNIYKKHYITKMWLLSLHLFLSKEG